MDCLNSLSSLDLGEMLDAVKEPCPGTLEWVLQHPRFQDWPVSTDTPVFNIVGKPGSGKSVLSAFLFRSGIGRLSSATPFYFAFPESGDGRSATAAWASLIHQLLLEDPSLFPTVFAQLGQPRRNAPGLKVKLWTASRLKQSFERLIAEFRRPSVYIIDALDQCDDDSMDAFVASFAARGAAPSHSVTCKLLVLSRQGRASSSLAARFPELASLDLDEETEHDKAIAMAVEQKVAELCKKWRLRSPQLCSDIINELCLKTDGMYLLPTMTIQSLNKVNPTPLKIKEVLGKLPDDLLSAYWQVLDGIQEADRQLAALVLLWVVFATRPMSLQELSSAVALDDSVASGHDLEMNTSIDLLGSPGVSELVGPILKVAERGGQSLVLLSHNSTREFLLGVGDGAVRESRGRGAPAWLLQAFGGSSTFPYSGEQLRSWSNRNLANRCFRYYSLCCLSLKLARPSQSLDDPSRVVSTSIPSYSAHLELESTFLPPETVTPEEELESWDPPTSLFPAMETPEEELESWESYPSPPRGTVTRNEDTKIYDAIHALAQAITPSPSIQSLRSVPRWLRKPIARCHLAEEWHETEQHNFTLHRELLRTASDNPIKDATWRQRFDGAIKQFPALRYCIENLPEHARLVDPFNVPFHRSLAAFLDSRFGMDWIAGFWAVRDPGQEYGKQPAIHFASALGLRPEIKSLLASGGGVHKRDQYGNTALDVATRTSDVDTMRMLYKTGNADLQARQMISAMPHDPESQHASNILHTAAWYGHKDATMYLLAAGLKPLVLDNDGLTALDIAVNARNGPLVKVLMHKPSMRDVASFAAQRGRLETLQWLVEEEQIDLLQFGTVALEGAIQHDQHSCAQYLSATIPSGDGHAYRSAAKHGKIAVLEDMITRRVVDINVVDHEGRGALHYACLQGQVAAVPFLIRAGIDTALADKTGYTALELLVTGTATMACSHQEQADMVAAFEDPHVQRRRPTKGGNLLHLALELHRGNDRLIKVLLDWGLDPLERDLSGRTILHAAATQCNPLLPKVLSICDLATAQDHLGQTPPHTALGSERYWIPTDIVAALVERMPDLGSKTTTAVQWFTTSCTTTLGRSTWYLNEGKPSISRTTRG